MGYSQETANYALPLYEADDRPSYLGDWNECMNKIDAGMQGNKQTAANNGTAIVNLTTRLETAESEISETSAKADTALSGAQNALNALNNVYTKNESDAKYLTRLSQNPDSIVGCIGDSILVGWSNENPKGIQSWDKYVGQALGFATANIFKAAIGGAGFACGTTFTEQVQTLKETITAAGKNTDNVTLIVVGGGINDARNNITYENVLQGTTSLVNAIGATFPNAEIHIFPGIIGNTGLDDRVLSVEKGAVVGCGKASGNYLQRATVHTGCWSWNYDTETGKEVSADRIHLLQSGLSRVGQSMAIEINGGSAYIEYATFTPTDINGDGSGMGGYRRGTTSYIWIGRNLTSRVSSDGRNKNLALGVDIRYGFDSLPVSFSNSAEDGNVLMFYDAPLGCFVSYTELSNKGVFGAIAYPIHASYPVT